MQCCGFFIFLFFYIWSLPATYLITLIFTLLQSCSWILKVFSAFALEQHLNKANLCWGEFLLCWGDIPFGSLYPRHLKVRPLSCSFTVKRQQLMNISSLLNLFLTAYRCSLLYNTALACRLLQITASLPERLSYFRRWNPKKIKLFKGFWIYINEQFNLPTILYVHPYLLYHLNDFIILLCCGDP